MLVCKQWNSEIHIIFFVTEQEMETEKYVYEQGTMEKWREIIPKLFCLSFPKAVSLSEFKGTKGKIFLSETIYFLAHKSHPGKIFFSLSIPSPIANLYSLLQFPSTSFTKYIIIYSFPQATISRDTFPIVGISQINHFILVFFPQYS